MCLRQIATLFQKPAAKMPEIQRRQQGARKSSEMLFQVISERSERASIIISTNLEFSNWTSLFENEIMVAALIDRITFRSHILNMNVKESYRLEQTMKENS